jgi:hypothetical protein
LLSFVSYRASLRSVEGTVQQDRCLTVVASSPAALAEARRLGTNRYGGTIYLDGVFGITVYSQQLLSLIAEDPFTLRGIPINFAVHSSYTLGSAESPRSILSGVPDVLLEPRLPPACFLQEFGGGISLAEPLAAMIKWAACAAKISAALQSAEVTCPKASMDESKLPHSNVSYTTLQQLRQLENLGIHPAYLLMDQEAALKRGARLWICERLSLVYCKYLQPLLHEIVTALDGRPLFSLEEEFDVALGTANKFLRSFTSVSVTQSPVGTVSDVLVAAVVRRVFNDSFADFITTHSIGRHLLSDCVVALLAYDFLRIRTIVSQTDHTVPLGLLQTWFDDVVNRWEATIRIDGPLCRFVRKSGALRHVSCSFHYRADWTSKLMGLHPPRPAAILIVGHEAASTYFRSEFGLSPRYITLVLCVLQRPSSRFPQPQHLMMSLRWELLSKLKVCILLQLQVYRLAFTLRWPQSFIVHCSKAC